MTKLTTEQKTEFYKKLIEKSPYEVGLEMGLDKEYPNKNSLRTYMYTIKKEVERDPAAYSITPEQVQQVQEISQTRALSNRQLGIDAKKDEDVSLLDLTKSVSKKAALHLDKILSSKTLPKGITIPQLVMAMGVSIEKTLLLTGRATENIAFKAKIDLNLTSDKLLEALIGIKDKDKNEK